MALHADCVFECRTTGNDNNGGGFKSSASGTDRSQQDAAHITLTVAATVHTTTTQLNVPGAQYTVSAADIGNVYQITSGTATAGFYEITAVDVPNNRWTVDRSMGTAAQTAAGSMGGALATPGKAGSIAWQTGNTLYIKAGTYSITSASTNVANGCMSLTGGGILIEGYQTTRGDLGTKPLLQASGITAFTLVSFGNNNPHMIRNVKLDGNSLSTGRGVVARCRIVLCEGVNFTNSAFVAGSVVPEAYFCTASGCSTQPAFSGVSAFGCVAYNNTIRGFDSGTTNTVYFAHCISDSNSGASSDGFLLSVGATNFATAINCVAYNNGRDGFRFDGTRGVSISNCIAQGNAGWGYQAVTPPNGGFSSLYNCAGYNNTSGNVTGFTDSASESLDFQTLTGSPFTDAPNQDFSLNNTASAGAACRAAGIPGVFPVATTTGYIDIGAAQTQTTAGGGGATSAAYIG